MLRRSILLASILASTAVACGNVVVDASTSGGNGGSTSGSGSTGSTTASSSGGPGSTVSTSVGVGGAGGSQICGKTHDTFTLGLGTHDGHFFACAGGEDGFHEMEAAVEESSSNFLVLDSCPPNADCIPFLSKLSLESPGLYVDVPKGTYVRVRTSVQHFMGGCAQQIQITNLDVWGGVKNPVIGGEVLWLSAADGDTSPFDDSPIAQQIVPQGCYPKDPSGCDQPDDYLWRFWSAQNPNDPGVTIPMGSTSYWAVKSGGFAHDVLIRNLRSFSIGYCDGPSDYAYWIAHTFGLE